MSLKAGGTHNTVSFSELCAEALKANILLSRALWRLPLLPPCQERKCSAAFSKPESFRAFMSGKGDCLGGLDVWAGLFGTSIVL